MNLTRTLLLSAISSLAIASAMPAYAQDDVGAQPDEGAFDPEEVGNEILVIARDLRGSVNAAQPPVQVLEQADIAAYGASSIADLVAALAPQTSSGRGRGGGPVFLVNGMRVSSFREMRSFPPEAIEKIEIMPEEVAQKFGFSADQRLINFILKENFSSREIEGEYGQPGAGGTSTKEIDATYLKIAGPSRFNLNAEWSDTSLLTEDERGLVQSVVPALATDPDPAAYRSLVADSSALELTANLTTKLADNGSSISLNGSYERDRSRSLSGLNTVVLTNPADESLLRIYGEDDPLERRSRSETISLGSTLNAPLGDWQLTGTLDASRTRSTTEIDRYADPSALVAAAAGGTLAIDGALPAVADAGFDIARTVSDNASSLVTVMGSPFYLPAGDVSLTVDAGYSWSRIQSEDTRNPGPETSLTRGNLSAGFNLGVPLTSRRDDVLSGLGDISLNFTAGFDHLSDFGTLTDWTAGLNWGITETLNLQTSYIARDAAPGLSQLNSPEILTLNVPTYDISRSETVLISTIGGGNPNLLKEKQRDIRIGASWDLPFLDRSSISVDYFRNNSSDVSAGFPLLTPAIEAAFPDRVTRDSSGRLISIDQRPITFESQKSSRLRFGLNLSGPLGKANPEAGTPAATGGGRGAGATVPAGAPGGGAGQGRGRFDPAEFAALRERFCAPGNEEVPELSALPEPIQATLATADGKLDPDKFAQFKQRVCSAEVPPQGGVGGIPPAMPGAGGPPPGGGTGQGRGRFDPAEFVALRERLCAPGNDEVPELSALPEPIQANLATADGKLDPDKFAQFKQRVCSADGPPRGGPGGAPPAMPGAGGPPPGAIAGGPPPGGPPPGGGMGGFRGGRGGGPGGGGDGRGRWFANLTYSLELENEVLIAEGLPVLDLLQGDALTGSGVVRHSAQLQGGLFYQGLGLRFSGNYSGPSRIDGTGLPGSTDLQFGSLATLDLRVFADLGQKPKLIELVPFLKGSRISLGVDNIFNSYRTITDSSGDVPLRYQPGFLDPQGRSFEIEFRKMF